MDVLRIILMPFAWLYDLVTRARNHLYNLGLRPSTAFDVPVIVIGNLSVGGTGKTPMTEYLARLLAPPAEVAILSRGYGRRTKGPRVANALDSADTVGDEPLQLYRKLTKNIVVAVGEDRVMGIAHIVDQFPETNVILLDDAFQHRRVRPRLAIVLTDFRRPFFRDFVLPAGRLRESRRAARRADIIVVTKCPPALDDTTRNRYSKAIGRYTSSPVFFATIAYGRPVPFGSDPGMRGKKILLVTGIAGTEALVVYLSTQFEIAGHLRFRDHWRYTQEDLQAIQEAFHRSAADAILTTEKDTMRLQGHHLGGLTSFMPWFYLPMEMKFMKNGEDFDAKVRAVLE